MTTDPPLPIPVARALRQLEHHARVLRIDPPRHVDGKILVTVTFDSNLPNRWRARGRSDNGILSEEPVDFEFSQFFPVLAPEIYLRPDFDRSHPHLQPRPASKPPVPCYVDGSPKEFMRLRGMMGIADQIGLWLERAAHCKLIDPDQGWEPVRRDHIDDVVVVDAARLRDCVGKDANGRFLNAPFLSSSDAALPETFTVWLQTKPVSLDRTLLADRARHFGRVSLGLAVWSGRQPSGEPFIARKYMPETVFTVADLISRATQLGCGDPLKVRFNLLRQRLSETHLARPLLLTVILIVRRPCNVIGQGSPLELCPYLIEVAKAHSLDEDSVTPVRPVMPRDEISTDLLRRASGIGLVPERTWTLLGAGSLGSKIALHMAREARPPTAVVDRAIMHPHNYARHALVPYHRAEAVAGASKASLLFDALKGFGHEASCSWEDAIGLCVFEDPKERERIWSRQHTFMVDATGSPTVTEVLCLPKVVEVRCRVVETSLMGAGRIAYCGVEGPDSNPSLMDLATESYRILSNDPAAAALAFSTQSQSVSIGQGCSAITAPMPDAMISASAASLATYLSKIHQDGLPASDGRILIGRIADNRLDQAWSEETVPPFTILTPQSDAHDLTVRISARVCHMIDEEVKNRHGVETGGVIVGRFSDVTNTFHIVDAIPAPPDSSFTRAVFKLGTEGLTEAISQLAIRSGGAIYPVGTWHNHLEDSDASVTDVMTSVQMALGQLFPVLLLIRTPGGFRFLTAEIQSPSSIFNAEPQ